MNMSGMEYSHYMYMKNDSVQGGHDRPDEDKRYRAFTVHCLYTADILKKNSIYLSIVQDRSSNYLKGLDRSSLQPI